MQTDALRQLYASKTEEELALLMADRESLTENAQQALDDELKSRNIRIPVPLRKVAVPSKAKPRSAVQVRASVEQFEPIDTPSRLLSASAFALNTVMVYVCAIYLSPKLVGMWFAWVTPITKVPAGGTAATWYLQYFELVTVIPALIAGYIDLAKHIPILVGRPIRGWNPLGVGKWSWALPAAVLIYEILTFKAPSSVLLNTSFFRTSISAYKYFFDIQSGTPDLPFRFVGDPQRMEALRFVTAPFFAGLAYSIGTLDAIHRLGSAIWNRLNSLRHRFV